MDIDVLVIEVRNLRDANGRLEARVAALESQPADTADDTPVPGSETATAKKAPRKR